MIDVHCHILPGVDDGSKNLEESIEMARIAQEDGIKKIINTSHYSPNFDYLKGEILIKKLSDFNKELKTRNIDVEVIIGNELYYSPKLIEKLDELDFYTLGGSKYILIEFPPLNVPSNLADIVYEIKLKGFTPILAHVERYKDIVENPNIVYDCIKEGAIIQINASSILGKNGKELKDICSILLENKMVHLVGSDAHGSNRRRPLMKESYNLVKETYSRGYANQLFNNNASYIIKNEVLKIDSPQRYEVKRGLFAKLFKK